MNLSKINLERKFVLHSIGKRYNIPFANDTEVKVVVIPKVNVEKMSFAKIQALTQPISGNLSDEIIRERHHP